MICNAHHKPLPPLTLAHDWRAARLCWGSGQAFQWCLGCYPDRTRGSTTLRSWHRLPRESSLAGPLIQCFVPSRHDCPRSTQPSRLCLGSIAKQGSTFNEVSTENPPPTEQDVVVSPLSEQHQLVQAILQRCSSLDTALASATSEISLLQEYRTRLIADVVTGKLDVRGAANRLPEEVEESPAVEEAEDFAELDEDTIGEELEEAVLEV